MSGTTKKSTETSCWAWFFRNVFHNCEGGLRCRTMMKLGIEVSETTIAKYMISVTAISVPDQKSRSFVFGWKHKEFMRNGTGMRRIMNIGASVRTLPWNWRVKPDGELERVDLDARRIDAVIREGAELSYASYDKLAIKPLKIDRNLRPVTSLRPNHHTGTARAGANRETSVCSSDFDCHDIDHLLVTSAASIPRTTFSWSMGPTAVGAAYAWRRMIANHFSRGCSTKGFA